MSMWADYKREREGVSSIELECGFITYRVLNESVFVEDLYIAPEFRRQGFGTCLGDEIVKVAKKNGCNVIFCGVCVDALNATDSMKAILSYGFQLKSISGNMIYLRLEI